MNAVVRLYDSDAPRPKGEATGNAESTDKITRETCDIANRQPGTGKYIVPNRAQSVSMAFSRACRAIGATELRFDNLRRAGQGVCLVRNPGDVAAMTDDRAA